MRVLVQTGNETWLNRHDGIFVVRADQLSDSDRLLLETAARAVLDAGKGTLSEQTRPMLQSVARLPALVPSLPAQEGETSTLARPKDLGIRQWFRRIQRRRK